MLSILLDPIQAEPFLFGSSRQRYPLHASAQPTKAPMGPLEDVGACAVRCVSPTRADMRFVLPLLLASLAASFLPLRLCEVFLVLFIAIVFLRAGFANAMAIERILAFGFSPCRPR